MNKRLFLIGARLFFAALNVAAIITQLTYSSQYSISFSLTNFFSFFTILTNTLAAIYFTRITFSRDDKTGTVNKPGALTAITVYIFMVGSVYQVVLRRIWKPAGLQLIVDELLHSVIPVSVIIFWALYENKKAVGYRQIPKWAIYPLAYLVYILIRGSFSDFYPYPFVNVGEIGMAKTILNSAVLVLVFFLVAALFVFIGKYFSKNQQPASSSQ